MTPVTADHEIIRNSFTNNVKASFPNPIGSIEGIAALKFAVRGMVGNFQTQHALSTQLIELTGDKTADATTYVTTVLFGVGKDEGKSMTTWGMYQDKLVKDSFDGQEDWKIAERRVISQLPLAGDLFFLSA
ncbi:SnoaL-like domain-containing protein [Penicillium hordei]|uniref:SnoaL-like domain-containing protein n=1 Tax=Penicillium hordei TaxID=40994 RepID=A0AAD6DKR9_9EURO|nr:SnoaL-like domain-containing protein [Penicillium hordei]KAJ5588191.1 SnoaL-like domain-containing protein [Penicillium hordei]